MARTEALKKAQDKYSQKVKQVILKFNMESEHDLLEHLQKQDRIQTYIKMLIKQDMEKGGQNADYYRNPQGSHDHVVEGTD